MVKNLILSIIALAILAGCSGKKDKTTEETVEAVPVKVQKLEKTNIAKTLDYTANLQADKQVYYAPAATGRIEKIYVEVGDRIKKGQLLVEMDRTQLVQAEVQLKNLETEYNRAVNLWNETYSECKLVDLKGKPLSVEPMFDICLDIFASKCKKVLDFGCGTGDIIFQCYEFGNTGYGLGVDVSETGINYATKMAKLNNYDNLEFKVGNISALDSYEDGSFDGIILSNVLDVMPKNIAAETFSKLTRLIPKGGLMFVKLNPYYEEGYLESFGFKPIANNLFEEDGVLRYREVDTASWKQAFEKYYEIIRYLEFPYPWQEGMNRLFLLQKK